MQTSKSQRFTISGRNLQFLKTIAEQMDETDLSAVLSYLLTDVRCLGWRVGEKPHPQPITQTSLGFEPFQPAFTPNRDGDRHERNYTELDPIISRLATLIEEF